MNPSRILRLTVAAVQLVACGEATAISDRVDLAFIIFASDTASIRFDDAPIAGRPAHLGIQTFGGGCTRDTAYTLATVRGRIAELRPFNRAHLAPGLSCTPDILFLYHNVSVRFDSAGPALIRIIGVRDDVTGRAQSVLDTIEQSILVR